MDYLTGDVNTEKHVPYIQVTETGYKVTLGKPALHPMVDVHLVQWVELYVNDELVKRHTLNVGDAPEALFETPKSVNVYAVAHCNIHGTWIQKL